MKKLNLLDIIVFLLMVLFLYAATFKLMDYDVFVAQLGKSPLIMYYAGFIAWFIPVVELAVAILLFIPRFRLAGLFASFSLMLSFTIYIFVILNYSSYVPCSCGGILNSMGWTEHLIFNISFTFLAALGIVLYSRMNRKVLALT